MRALQPLWRTEAPDFEIAHTGFHSCLLDDAFEPSLP